MLAMNRIQDAVQRVHVGLDRGDDNIGVGTVAINYPPAVLKSDRDLALGIGSGGNGVD